MKLRAALALLPLILAFLVLPVSGEPEK